MKTLKFATVCVVLLCSLQNVLTSPTVQINDSRITGQRMYLLGHEVNQYLGVPYAEPPLGPLRFKKPLPVLNYPPDIKAVTNPPACPQYTKDPYPWYINSTHKSEDCLYLNFWTPADASPTNKKAVLFWIHGGGNRYGSIRSEVYSGIPLASLGDIIVVTVNYRVGPFGFLTSGTEDAPGNIGLWDILEGLRWVNKNIGAFGGDTTRITIAGESAGANNVGFLSTSPLAKGLYTRQIMESGSPMARIHNTTLNVDLGQRFANLVGCANDTFTLSSHPKEVIQCLIGVDADTLSRADFVVVPHSTTDFYPQFGDELLPEDPRTAVFDNNFSCADLLIGINKEEGSIFATTHNPDVFGFFGEKRPHVNRTLARDMIQKEISSFPNSESIADYYFPASVAEDTHYQIRHQFYTAVGDVYLFCPAVYYAEKCAEQGRNVYYFLFDHRPSSTSWAKWMGVAHFDEVQFVFGQPILNPEKYDSSEVLLSVQIIDIWSNFVKHGKPNIPWPLYSKDNPSFKFLGHQYPKEKNGARGPHYKNCKFLRPFY